MSGWRVWGDPAQDYLFGLLHGGQRRVVFYEYDRDAPSSGPNGGRGEALLLVERDGGPAGERREIRFSLVAESFEPGRIDFGEEGFVWTPLD